MSAISLILLCTATAATALGGAALHTALGLRRELTALRAQLDADAGPGRTAAGSVPRARDGASTEEIRAAVAAALADERDRELAEARAFWAAQEARDAGPEGGALLAGHGTEYEVAPSDLAAQLDALLNEAEAEDDREHGPDCGYPYGHGCEYGHGHTGEIFIPRQIGPDEADCGPVDGLPLDGLEALEGAMEAALEGVNEGPADPGEGSAEPEGESPGLAAARRRHPSHPDYNLNGEPVAPAQAPSSAPTVADHERTVERLAELAHACTPLADVRPGPLGTLDVYVFADGTTICLSPGHRATSESLIEALRRGEAPVLMGGSGIAGSYALTFGLPDGGTAYLLADRVIASG